MIANDVRNTASNMPYGGEKDSGFGYEAARYPSDEITALWLFVTSM